MNIKNTYYSQSKSRPKLLDSKLNKLQSALWICSTFQNKGYEMEMPVLSLASQLIYAGSMEVKKTWLHLCYKDRMQNFKIYHSDCTTHHQIDSNFVDVLYKQVLNLIVFI